MPSLLHTLLLCSLVLGLSSPVAGQTANGAEPPVLRVGFNASPPLAYFKEDGAPDGQAVRLARQLLAKAGQPTEIGIYPTPRLLKSLQDGELDLSMQALTPTLEDCCLFSKTPVTTLIVRGYWLGERQPIRSREELVGKSLIVLHGYSYAGLIDSIRDESRHNRLETANSFAAALQMLESGSADYLLAYETNMQEHRGGRQPKNLRSEVIDRFPVHLVLNKNYPDAARAMTRLESLLKELDAGR